MIWGMSIGTFTLFARGVSLANLRGETCPMIGQYLREAALGYVEEWKASQRRAGRP